MRRPKGKLMALLAIFVAIGIVTATGAFSSVQADRTVAVEVAEDSAALLAIQSTSQYATQTASGELLVDFTSSNGEFPNLAEGVNTNATTNVDRVFNVTNNGGESVDINLWSSDNRVSLYNSTDGVDSEANVTSVSSGDTIAVGMTIDTTDLDAGTNFNATITIEADAI